MRIMEDVKEGCDVQPSSPGHAEQRSDEEKTPKETTGSENGLPAEDKEENGREDVVSEPPNPKSDEVPKEEEMSPENEAEIEEKTDKNSDSNHVIEEAFSDASSSELQNNKRKHDGEDVAIKKLRLDLQENFTSRDKILSEFMEISECSNIDQIQLQCDNILGEIRMLSDVAREKEREWNNVLHLKKLKEELLLRLQRRKQILLLNDKSVTDSAWEAQIDVGTSGVRNNCSNQSILKANLSGPARARGDRNQNRFRNILPRPQASGVDVNGVLDYRGTPRQRPVLDVQSIIADYRQRHPETVPRRGRRIRNNNNNSDGGGKSNGVMNFSSLTLGSGAQVRHNVDMNNELGLLLSAFEANRGGNRAPGADSSQVVAGESSSFRDMLVNLSRLSQSERNELIQNAIKPPPPYPEVTVHPVLPATTSSSTSSPSNSLLHGILTKSPAKSSNGSKSSFSPTLARLLTAPERGSGQATTTISTVVQPGNVSISEILATSKARSEITITPVGGSPYDNSTSKARSGQIEEEEAEDSADRLVIDESTEGPDGRRGGDNGSDVGDEVPQCQGCNQKAAQFVCAGCGNQWYCSRDCQVSAWDEHSEVCSG